MFYAEQLQGGDKYSMNTQFILVIILVSLIFLEVFLELVNIVVKLVIYIIKKKEKKKDSSRKIANAEEVQVQIQVDEKGSLAQTGPFKDEKVITDQHEIKKEDQKKKESPMIKLKSMKKFNEDRDKFLDTTKLNPNSFKNKNKMANNLGISNLDQQDDLETINMIESPEIGLKKMPFQKDDNKKIKKRLSKAKVQYQRVDFKLKEFVEEVTQGVNFDVSNGQLNKNESENKLIEPRETQKFKKTQGKIRIFDDEQ